MTAFSASFAFAGASLFAAQGCHRQAAAGPIAASNPAPAAAPQPPAPSSSPGFAGFDRNDYPGDSRLAALRQHFRFTGYWLTAPPGETASSWLGHRAALRDAGFGFLLLANGRLDAQIKNVPQPPAAQGRADAAAAIRTAQAEGFPASATIFLDQEEGGRLLPEQLAYFLGWTEAVAASPYRPGAYLSGQPVPDGTGPDGRPATITTARDVQDHITAAHLHPVAFFLYNDSCPPSPGCSATAPVLSAERAVSGVDAMAWQYAQSPRRPQFTAHCAATYAPDNQCYGGASTDLYLDLSVAASADPSHAR